MFNYVNIVMNKSKDDQGINLFFEDHCIAYIPNKFLANKIRKEVPNRKSTNVTINMEEESGD